MFIGFKPVTKAMGSTMSKAVTWGYQGKSRRRLTKRVLFIRTMHQHTKPWFQLLQYVTVAFELLIDLPILLILLCLSSVPQHERTFGWEPILYWWRYHICWCWLLLPWRWKLLPFDSRNKNTDGRNALTARWGESVEK